MYKGFFVFFVTSWLEAALIVGYGAGSMRSNAP